MNTIKIMQAQMHVPDSAQEALEIVQAYCKKAAALGADMLTLPEMFCCPYEAKNFPVYAEEEGGAIWRKCKELASAYDIYLSAGSMPERDASGKVYNTAYVFDRKGNQIAKHRKMHLFDIAIEGGQTFRESDTLTAGETATVFDTEFGRMGLCICYDFRFPELGRMMALQGAQVVLAPAAFNMSTGPAHWELMFRGQAMFNQFFTVGTAPARNMAASYHSWGHSIAVNPWGEVVHQMDESEGYQMIDLDISLVSSVRAQLPLLAHRRTDIYTL